MTREFESIAATKLVPPHAARRMIMRDQLIARLLDARRKRCVVLQGPAGSGKTSTLVAWRKTLLTLDYDVAWLSVSAEDNDPTRFFDCLLACVAEVDATCVKDAALLMGRDSDDSAIEHWVITLVQGLARRQRELVLMLDDVQHLTDPRIVQALQWLVEYVPRQVHLTLASRVPLPLSLVRLRSHGQLAEFDLRDLRFTADESEAFLREHVGAIDKRDTEVVHELTGGWVAGLQLFAIDIKAKQGASYKRVEVRDARAFAGYFEREVLVRVDHDDLELLTRLAICNRFCASLCATLMGQPHAKVRMAMRLTRLDNDALFVSQVGTQSQYDEAWYRLHPLLREVLLARWEARPATERLALHAAAWRWFDERGQVDEAVRHAVQAGEPQAAADRIEQCAADMLARGDLSQLSGLLRRLPSTELQSRIGLRLMIARLKLYARDLDAFEKALTELERDIALLNPSQRNVLTLLRAGLALQRDDSDSMVGLLPELQRIHDDDQNVTGRANVLSWMYMYRGEFDKARQVLSDGAGHSGSPRSSLMGKCLGGMAHELEGQIIHAERIFREVLHEAEARGGAFIDLACMAVGLLGDTLHESNDPGGAIHHLQGRIELIERVAIPDTVLRALLVLSSAHWLEGRHLEAWAYLERLEDYGLRHRLDRLRSHALALRLRWHLEEGDTWRAKQALAELCKLAARHEHAEVGTLWEVGLNAGCAEADMLIYRRDHHAAAEWIEALVARAETGGRWRRVASLRMQLAICERQRGRDAEADAQLVQALQLGHGLGLMRTLLDASPDIPGMLAALPEDRLDPVLAFYTQRLKDAAPVDGIAGDEADEGEVGRSRDSILGALSEREGQILDLLAQAMPNKKIARVLSLSPETVKWHLKNIYGKLGVASRDEAVGRLRDLRMDDSPEGIRGNPD